MKTVVTSQEEILKAAKNLALSGGLSHVSIRSVAKACGISVGTVYNYYGTKSDLVLAVVAQVWQEIFHPTLRGDTEMGFLELVDRISGQIRTGMERQPAFFSEHIRMDGKEQRDKGRAVMEQAFRHIKDRLLETLLRDQDVRPGAWTETFRPEELVEFVFDFWKLELLEGRMRSGYLKEIIIRAVY